MTKVEQGIEINSQHLYNVLNDIPEEVSFRDQILELGYETIEQFFEEKAIFEMQQTLKNQVSSVPMPKLLSKIQQFITNQQYRIISIYTDETCVCHGDDSEKQLNEEYCEENNIPVYPYDSFGGNIVATEEDFGLAILLPDYIDISIDFVLATIANILTQYFENVEVQGNDILINDKKVVGSGSLIVVNTTIILLYFSMEDKGELIENICGQPTSGKEPGYIEMSSTKLQKEVLSWLQGL